VKVRKLLAGLLIAGISIGATANIADAHSSRRKHRHRYAVAGYVGGIPLRSGPLSVVRSGKCNWLAPHLAAVGLPVSTFMAISARESGCAVGGVRVATRTDLSTSRFGLNFRGSMPRYWSSLCGVSDWRAPGASVSTDVRCAAAAYHRMGLRPWKT